MSQKRIKKSEIDVEFHGYEHHKAPGQFFMYPMELTDYWWALSGSEQKVLDFIIRKTFGWQQQGDNISISQIMDGEHGRSGTGLSRSQVKLALNSLEKKKFIKITRRFRKPSYIELPLGMNVRNLDGYSDIDAKIYRSGLNKEYKKDIIAKKQER